MFQAVKKIDGRVLWSNLFLLFWLSLILFASGWVGENHFENITVMFYGFGLLGCAFGYYLVTLSILKIHDSESLIYKSVGNKFKEHISLLFYILGLGLSYWVPQVSFGINTIVAIIWLLPDTRIEKQIT